MPPALIESLGLHHVALRVQDVASVARFYRELLGLKEIARFVRTDHSLRSIWLSAAAHSEPGAAFLAIEDAGPETKGRFGGVGMVAFNISVEARRNLPKALEVRGLKMEHETRWTSYLRDPEGNLVGLSHHPRDIDSASVHP